MQLIIRVTGRCNFDCTFCSAGSLNIAHPTNGVPEQIKEVIETIKPTGLVISGGDPLLVDPSYYYELLEMNNGGIKNISITSNMKDFYFHPDKWIDLFKNPRIGIITSFNYGNTRKWDSNTIYDEDKFIEIYNLYHEKTGEKLAFIAVIDKDNKDTVIKTVKLAKRLGTICKVNNVLQQGRSDVTYPRYKMFQHYIDIIDAGLRNYEIYCKNDINSKCPINSQFLCKSSIRSCYVDKDNNLHYFGCGESEIENPLDFHQDKDIVPCQCYPKISEHVNSKCISCELFSICNGCETQRNSYPPEHCEEMLKLKHRLIEQGWVKELI